MKQSKVTHVLKRLLFKHNIKPTQLARRINVPQQTLQRIITGQSPNPHGKTLQPIADFFNISLEQLKGERPLPEEILQDDLPIANPTAKPLSVLEWHQITSFLQDPQTIDVQDKILVDASLNDQIFAVRLNDSSMEPYFPSGAILILDPQKEPEDRHLVLVKIADSESFIFRQLLIDGDYQYLKPLNPDLNAFPMRLLHSKDQILGTMIEFRCRYDKI